MQQDVLSDVCAGLRLRSDLYFTAELADEFSVDIPADGARIRFHLVLAGGCKLLLSEDAPAIDLCEGDLVLVPNGRGHILCDTPETSTVPLADAMAAGFDPVAGMLRNQVDGGCDVRLLCGFCAFDDDYRHPGFGLMDDHVILRADDAQSDSGGTAQSSIVAMIQTLAQTAEPGWRSALARLMEVLVISLMAAQLKRSDMPQGFLAGLADAKIARALSCMHGQPDRDWTAELLAKQAGMSRTRFVLRFGECVGIAPMQYLQNWRMGRAKALLRDTNLSMDEIALRCGYQSMPAFSRRFKAQYGEGPGAFRRGLRKPLAAQQY
ncbi:AraC family transcriptional regulator [Thalassospira sp. HF15]|uniref:AraC family transcriptional regulator n=1 Tax=Thalassospira sp. HF15 TaxID=2722755 RepID=UPI001431A430|nr:AraC family transcriptional regulator [Thalassospira sp. HF15]NIY74023.1 AraC family transcriptional regulator [Thalassospira sp. HF15]